jgi:hypothetical protein
MAEMEQKATGYTLVILALLFLFWLFRKGNPFLHEQVTATLAGAPIGAPDFYAGAQAPAPCKTC